MNTDKIKDKTLTIREVMRRMTAENMQESIGFIRYFLDDIDELSDVVLSNKTDAIIPQLKPNYVLIQHLTSIERIEDIKSWLNKSYSIAINNMLARHDCPFDLACSEFLIFTCGNKYNGDNHLWNAFRLFWRTYKYDPPQQHDPGGSLSVAYDNYFGRRDS